MTLDDIKARLDSIFPRLGLGAITRSEIEDDCLCFDVDRYPFMVGLGTEPVKSLIGPIDRQVITLTILIHHPGRFNPYDGGMLPDVEDVELGQFQTVYECVRKMVDTIMAEKIEGLCEIVEDELAPEPDDFDDSMDGDFDSGMASAGFGTDEDYGYFGGDE